MSNLARVIHTRPANPALARSPQVSEQKLRVAAYARVSTDAEEQLTSYHAQIAYYTQKIQSNPNWTLSGIFADEGLSGTSTRKRDEFNKLIAICKKGKVDLILVKSISRFARNTLDCIDHVRKLKAMGVGVHFEEQNINTLTMDSEMVLTMLSAFAQAESESISANVKWGKRHALKQGKVPFQYKRILGYERGEDDKPKIVPEQADIVRRIFGSFLAGYSIGKIKLELETEGLPSPTGKAAWSQSRLHYMLQNEKYIGDALLQKTYIVDCISKQVKKNNGEVAQYYIENNHEAIIPKDMFLRVQEELARRSSKRRVSGKAQTERGKYSSKYALTELLVCGDCGTHYRRVTWARGGKKKIVWRCINRLENGPTHCKESPTIEEGKLHDAIKSSLNHILDLRDEVIITLEETLQIALSGGKSPLDRLATQQEISRLEENANNLLQLAKDSGDGAHYFDAPLAEIYEQRTALLDKLDEDEKQRGKASASSAKLERLIASIQNAPAHLEEYSEEVTRELVEQVRVLDAERLIVTLKGGMEIEANTL